MVFVFKVENWQFNLHVYKNFLYHRHSQRFDSTHYTLPVDLYLIPEKSIWKNLAKRTFKPAKINYEIDFCRLKIQFVKLDFTT